jgi:hypothetical protein
MTNATKANIIAAVNTALILAVSFGLSLSDAQQVAVVAAVNAALALYVSLTYQDSPKRIPDEPV